MYFEHHFWGMHFFWWLFLIFIILWIFAKSKNNYGMQAPKETPLEILKRRFANGEISKEEFEEKKKILSEN